MTHKYKTVQKQPKDPTELRELKFSMTQLNTLNK